MPTHEIRGNPEAVHAPPADEFETSGISVAQIIATLSRYRRTIAFWIAAVVLLYSIGALVAVVYSPGITTTSLPFRLDFEGAENGLYPNGLKFSSTDIVGANVLARVYEMDNAARYMTFRRFKEAVFLEESSRELETLNAQFDALLSDPKLSSVDRERIEREYQLRRSSLRHAEFSLNFADDRRLKRVPADAREKILRDVLSVWAEVADREKGAVKYRWPVLTSNVVVRDSAGPREYLIELDVLRARIDRILANIDQLLRIPGSELVRVGSDKISLTEISVNLGEISRYQVAPLITHLSQTALMRDPRMVSGYYQAQLSSAQRDYEQANAHVAALRHSLTSYTGGQDGQRDARQAQNTPAPAAAPGDAITPQLSESFLDRIVKLATDSSDMKYRQDLVNETTRVTIAELLPAQRELQYYQNFALQMTAPGKIVRTGPSPGAQDVKFVADAENAAYEAILKALRQVSEAYLVLSRNLNPDGVLYTLSGPAIEHTAHSIAVKQLILIGILVLSLALPVILLGCLLHAARIDGITADVPHDTGP